MAPKKRKADPVESAAAAEPAAGNHRQEPASSENKPRGTIYFPITDDPPEPTATADEDEDEGAGDDEDDVEDIGKLLEPLSREQLVSLLRTAAEASPATMAAVRRAAESDPASRKLFVHGLGWGAGADDLRSAFSRFGELEDCRVISDKQSGRSKGYGFVLFRSRRSALRALRRPQLQIGGRLAFCHLAASGAQQQAFAQPNAMLAMLAAMQNPAALGMTPAMLAAMNPAFAAAALGAGGQQAHTAGLAGFGAQGFGTQAFGAGGATFPNAAGVQAAAAAYQGGAAPPGFQGPPGFQAGQATTQTSTAAAAAAAAAASAAGYQAGAAGQGQVPGAQIGGTGFQGGY
ncbi:unnamed protein product [Urochloa decumbens]|uniref:RRM domain-containing protein n=1 Tax=Urochloa decumbens TaxID=240449 RepID=A0ABC9D1V4_9POAL